MLGAEMKVRFSQQRSSTLQGFFWGSILLCITSMLGCAGSLQRVKAEKVMGISEGQNISTASARSIKNSSNRLDGPMVDQRAGKVDPKVADLLLIGVTYVSLQKNEKAFDYYQKALETSRGVGDTAGEARSLTNIGVALAKLGREREALAHCIQALEINRRIGDSVGEAKVQVNIRLISENIDRYARVSGKHPEGP